ncbi:hypothetical protein [Faecalibaculum rodentium]|uniref:hypothetical protein n=1 Tax=Faecalibaculum rodentium TaxID=1702221 RepID=UPI0025A2CE0A|nr:hypothetical protein [Faecalibaculum rodentium]
MSEPEGLSATLQINGVMVTNDYRQLKNVPTINGQRMEGELTDEQKDATRDRKESRDPRGIPVRSRHLTTHSQAHPPPWP